MIGRPPSSPLFPYPPLSRSHRHDRVLRVVIGGAWLGFTPMVFARSFTAILTGWALYAVFSVAGGGLADAFAVARVRAGRSEEHTSELPSPCNIVCRLLLEKK